MSAVFAVPSYVIPGTYLENVRFLDPIGVVRGIELLFFSYDAQTSRLLGDEIEGIREYSKRFRFTVHMPDPLQGAHAELVETLHDLADAFVVHVPSDGPGGLEKLREQIRRWRSAYGAVFRIENVAGRAIDVTAPALAAAPLCCDTGHLLLDGESPSGFLDRLGERIEEIHLHTAVDGKDHRPIQGTEPWLERALPFLRSFDGTLVAELFDIDLIMPMADILRRLEIITG